MFRLSGSKGKGFTLFELLVVMSIIVVLSTALFANYRSGQKQYALSQAAQKLISDLRRVQGMAMSGVGLAGQYYGYGVFAQKNGNSYVLYGDANGNDEYDGGDTIVETIDLPSRVIIQNVSPGSTDVDFFFKSPDPLTFVNGSSADGVTGLIILGVAGTSNTRTITVNTAGLIQ